MPTGQDLHGVPWPGSSSGSSPGGHCQRVLDVGVAKVHDSSEKRQDRGQHSGLSFIIRPQSDHWPGRGSSRLALRPTPPPGPAGLEHWRQRNLRAF